MYCEHCGNLINAGDAFCSDCGEPVNGVRYCQECGKPVDNADTFCEWCGSVIETEADIFCEECGRPLDPLTGRCPHCTERRGRRGLQVDIADRKIGGRTLIRDVRFEAYEGDFILILGSSGSGKTTLINAILGEGRANGSVFLNGQNFYDNYKIMKSQIGIVPQFLDLRDNDKVKSTLMDIAEMKLVKFNKKEKEQRVAEVLKRLGIESLSERIIRTLSGGQKKKVSVASQLIGYQKVFICDEPDSGLDAASRMQQMEILKDISDTGKIVIVISHEPDDAYDRKLNEYYFTKILVLAKSVKDSCGHLAFYGSPDQALDFFGVDKLQDIMLEINSIHEGGRGKADYYIRKYNVG